jgi:hypothetical protein
MVAGPSSREALIAADPDEAPWPQPTANAATTNFPDQARTAKAAARLGEGRRRVEPAALIPSKWALGLPSPEAGSRCRIADGPARPLFARERAAPPSGRPANRLQNRAEKL